MRTSRIIIEMETLVSLHYFLFFLYMYIFICIHQPLSFLCSIFYQKHSHEELSPTPYQAGFWQVPGDGFPGLQASSVYSATQQATILLFPYPSVSLSYRKRLHPIPTLWKSLLLYLLENSLSYVCLLPANLLLINPTLTVVYHSFYDSVQITVWFLSLDGSQIYKHDKCL